MNLRTGVDLIEISRVKLAVERYADRFLQRIYTPAEQQLCDKNYASLAARFAAKEAVAKALGCGLGDVSWIEIEVLREPSGAPALRLHGKARQMAKDLELTDWAISLSHTREFAIAQVVASSSQPTQRGYCEG
jgi:holo-[acyl-carrier protein] synthase